MSSNILTQLTFIMPELFIALGSIILLLIGLFLSKNTYKIITIGAIALLAVVLIMILKGHHTTYIFNYALQQNLFTRFLKILIILSTIFFLILTIAYNKFEMLDKFELPILGLCATLGMLIMVSASNMLSLYLGLELQSLSLYALTAFDRGNIKSSEAGMKYFILGSLSSGILLYGISIIYGYTGHLSYLHIVEILKLHNYNLGMIFGIIFIICGITFKLSAAPFHMWTPDVYEGAPTPVTAFFASAGKIAAVGALVNLIIHVFMYNHTNVYITPAWKQVLAILAVLSMTIGAFGAIGQKNIKRLIAYSSINHVGYILLAIFALNLHSVTALLTYLTIYFVTIIGVFTFIISLRIEGNSSEEILNISGLAKTNSFLAIIMTIFVASLAGLPPLAGFFTKWYILNSLVQDGYISLVIVAVLLSVVSAFYYLRLIKIMWLDEPKYKFKTPSNELKFILIITSIFLLLYIFFSAWLNHEIYIAASSLF